MYVSLNMLAILPGKTELDLNIGVCSGSFKGNQKR